MILDWLGYQLMLRGPWRMTCNPDHWLGAWCLRRAGGWVHRNCHLSAPVLTDERR